MKEFVNQILHGIAMPVVVGIAIIGIIAALIAGPGKTAVENMFDQAVSEISSEMK